MKRMSFSFASAKDEARMSNEEAKGGQDDESEVNVSLNLQ
jgi:hypothetical protein